MGTKGRDMLLWLFIVVTLIALVAGAAGCRRLAAPLFWMQIVIALAVGYYYWVYRPRAIVASRARSLEVLVLMPVQRFWADWLLRLSGKKIRRQWLQAYEIHLQPGLNKSELVPFLKALEKDLMILEKDMPGCLFLWETSAPVPSRSRHLIRELAPRRMAFWERGGWPVPRIPGISRGIVKKKCHYGAIIAPLPKGGKKLEQESRDYRFFNFGFDIYRGNYRDQQR